MEISSTVCKGAVPITQLDQVFTTIAGDLESARLVPNNVVATWTWQPSSSNQLRRLGGPFPSFQLLPAATMLPPGRRSLPPGRFHKGFPARHRKKTSRPLEGMPSAWLVQ